ncbi:MAG: metallophosphoesterase [Pontiellaceae bacterium]|jgi:hypothetical protein|nr:metallophosphoesterase [Pontiellaceae bacterium]
MKKVCFFMGICLLLAGSLSAAVIKGPYMIYAGSSTGMTVLWQTDAAESCTLEWGTDLNYSSGSVNSAEINTSHQYKETLAGLTEGTFYYYRVTAGTATYTGSFKTAPASNATDVNFLVYGDTRGATTNSPANDHNLVAGRIVSTVTADSSYQTFALHVGDFVYSGQKESSWAIDFFPRSQPSILSMHSKVPLVGTMGNHEETGGLFKKYFPYPFVADRYWSFDYGPVHVCVVDQCMLGTSDTTGFTLSSAQYNWLTNDLAATSRKWKVILVHHPGFSAGSHTNNPYMTDTLHPLFVQYDVTAVYGGHNHYYARAVKDGIHYVTTGGGGAPQNTPNASYPNVVSVMKTLQFCKVSVTRDQYNCKSVKASDGMIIDDFTVTKITTTDVPWVTNMTLANAGASITNARLVVSSVTSNYSSTVAAGLVISQTPPGGTTVDFGTPVALEVSRGPVPSYTLTFTSIAAHDGYVDESSETSNVGGTIYSTSISSSGLRIGDTGAKKQRKSFISFNTAALPDNAAVIAATLKLKCGAIANNPSGLGTITVDIKNTKTGFNGNLALESADFQAAASKSDVGSFNYPSGTNVWITASLDTNGTSRIAKTNHTQFRIRFTKDDDNDTVDDYLGFYPGDNSIATNRPVLVVTYQ